MSESSSASWKAGQSESDQRERVQLTARLPLRQLLTARRAAAIIAGITFLITVGGEILERLLDPKKIGLWVALLTGTALSYGDVTPDRSEGRIAAVLILTAIGFLTVIAALVRASRIGSGRRRFTARSAAAMDQRLGGVNPWLARIEAGLTPGRLGGSSDGIG